MSLHKLAKQVAAHGRGDDTVLIHMTPAEVGGLQALAMAHGGSLSINPHTGLPEAGFLKSILPMLAGAVVSFIPGLQGLGMQLLLAQAAAGAAAQGAATGDWRGKNLLLGALGGWGGGGLGKALAGAGAGALGGPTAGAARLGSMAAQSGAATTGLTGLTNAARGIGAAVMNPNTIGKQVLAETGKARLAAASLPTLNAAMTVPRLKGDNTPQPEYQMFNYELERNPNWTAGGTEPYFSKQRFGGPQTTKQNPFSPTYAAYDKKGVGIGAPGPSPMEQFLAAQKAPQTAVPEVTPQQYMIDAGMLGPIAPAPVMTAAAGGAVPSLSNYIGGLNAMRPPPVKSYTAPVAPDMYSGNNIKYLMNNPLEAGPSMRARDMNYGLNPTFGGKMMRLAEGGRLIDGPGDGVSDDIPAEIDMGDGTKQPARLAKGEFVIDAQTVAKAGNGSTEAGAKKFLKMMDRIHAIPTRPGKNLNAEKYMPA